MPTSKAEKFLIGLQTAQHVLNLLDQSGIDINRLVGISNAQGPQAKIIQGALAEASVIVNALSSIDAGKRPSQPRPSKKKKQKVLLPANRSKG
jgi:hypothetical protein